MKLTSTLSLEQETWDGVNRLLDKGDFRGTPLRRRSRSEVIDTLLKYALGKWPAWEQERLNALER